MLSGSESARLSVSLSAFTLSLFLRRTCVEPERVARNNEFFVLVISLLLCLLQIKKSPPTWKSLYSSRQAYGLQDLSLEQMQLLFQQLQQDPDKRRQYWETLHRNASASEWIKCGEECQQKAIREIQIISPAAP